MENAITSIITNSFFLLILGAFIPYYLQRERVKISSIKVRKTSKDLNLSSELQKKLNDCNTLNSIFKKYTINEACSELLLKKILEALEGDISLYMSKLDTSKKLLYILTRAILIEEIVERNKFLNGELSKSDLPNGELKQLLNSNNKYLETQITYKEERIKRFEFKIKELESIIIELVNEIYKNNHNEYQLEVAIYNKGFSQAILKYEGLLNIEKKSLKFKKNHNITPKKNNSNNEEFLFDFLLLKSRSFAGMNLVVDTFENKTSDIDFFENEYKFGQKEAVLNLYNINNKSYIKHKFKFRKTLEEQTNEQLRSYLIEKYLKYLIIKEEVN